jgi:sortase A
MARKGVACKIIVSVLIVAGISFLCAGFWIPAKAILAQHLLQSAWQQSLTTGNIVKPWPWADTWPVGRLANDRLGVDLIVLEGESGEVLAFGPGHLRASSAPGEGGHCMLAGHRDTSFAFLKDLRAGDILLLEGKSGKERFLVRTAEVVRVEDLYLDGEVEGYLTLITCFPFKAVTPNPPDRFIVTAMKVFDDH